MMEAVPSLPAWCRIVREVTPELTAAIAARPAMQTPANVAALVTPRLGAEEVEVFAVVMLDAQGRVIALQEVTRGLVDSSLCHPREVFRLAIAMNASSVVLAHNHPSGVLTPSEADRDVTRMLAAAGDLLGIPVRDHLIVGTDPTRYTSFAQAGLI